MKSREAPVTIQKMLYYFEKWKYVLLVALVGGVLLLWPSDSQRGESHFASQQTSVVQGGGEFDLNQMEQRLSAVLSKIDGAGEVTVLLTVQNSPRRILAVDEQRSETQAKADTVVVSMGSGKEEPVLVEQIYPTYQGALVVCSGADSAGVRLEIMEAVSALTGLGADKISICKGK